jgi:hypothetical protein
MGRERKDAGVAARLETLLERGDHARAAAEARRTLADATTPEPGRREAADVLASLRPEPGAMAVGLLGLLLAGGILIWLLTG